MHPLRLLAVACLALAGCDDLLLFDVAPDGRVICAVDALGRVQAMGDAAAPRHLIRLDPTTGEAIRLTERPIALSWPRACGDTVLVIEDRKRLVSVGPRGKRTVWESPRRLLQPTPSPAGDRVAVLEVDRLGEPGALRIIDLSAGTAGPPLEGVLVGYTWTSEGLAVARVSQPTRRGGLAQAVSSGASQRFAGGEGEIVLVRGRERRVLHTGPLTSVTWFAPASVGLLCVLPRRDQSLGLVRLAWDGQSIEEGEAGPFCDLWPAADGAGKLLFTRATRAEAGLQGGLRLASLDALQGSVEVPTQGPVIAPRRVKGDLVAYVTPEGRLFTQATDGSAVTDWSPRLRTSVIAGGPR